MPTLQWLTRDEDVTAADAVPYRLLEEVPELGAGDPATGNMVMSDIEAETRQVMKNLGAILEKAEMTFTNIVKTSIFLKDITNNELCHLQTVIPFCDDIPLLNTHLFEGFSFSAISIVLTLLALGTVIDRRNSKYMHGLLASLVHSDSEDHRIGSRERA